jgi:hypothetical protein
MLLSVFYACTLKVYITIIIAYFAVLSNGNCSQKQTYNKCFFCHWFILLKFTTSGPLKELLKAFLSLLNKRNFLLSQFFL